MENTRATRKDVARLAGVSTTTVTNVLNGRNNVGEECKRRVQEAMKILRYRPNLIARSLITQRSNHLVVLIEDISDLHHSVIVDAFQKEAAKRGYFVSIYIRHGSLEEMFETFISRGVEGIFMMIAPSEARDGGIDNTLDLIKRLSANGVSVVVGFNCYHDVENFSSLEGDFGGAVSSAVDYLVSLGHRHIGLLNVFEADYPFDNRYAKFAEAMKKHFGVENPPAVLGQPPYPAHIDTGEQYTRELLEKYPETTAIIGTNDMLSIGALSYLTDTGRSVPDDVSIVSIGDVSILQHFKPAITAMSLNLAEYGRAAVNILVDSLETGNTYVALHRCVLHARSTTAPPPRPGATLPATGEE